MIANSIYLASLALFAAGAQAAANAASLINSAELIPNGQYYIQNVATGEQLAGSRNNMYPARKGTPVQVAAHIDSHGRHTTMGKGGKGQRKCIAAQWSYSTGSDSVGAMYNCALGVLAQGNPRSSLNTDKQAFILVSASSNGKRDVNAADVQLEERSIFDNFTNEEGHDGLDDPLAEDEAGDIDTDDVEFNDFEKRASRHRGRKHHKTHRKVVKKVHRKKKGSASSHRHKSSGGSKAVHAKGKKSYGPFYIITTDHIHDQAPRALSNQVVRSLGQMVIRLLPWQKGNRNEQWVFIPA